MAFDYKKEYKEYYLPKESLSIIEIPKMNFLAVRGRGNPNTLNGEYQRSIELLYAVAYTLKMSYKTPYKIKGFFDYVVPPLEGFWWQEDTLNPMLINKDKLSFISIIRLPDFINEDDFNWAISEATKKKKIDFSKVEYFTYDEGLVVQAVHIGPFDTEGETVKKMDEYALNHGYQTDINNERFHHEIYLSDFRKVEPSKLKTIIRHPVKKKES